MDEIYAVTYWSELREGWEASGYLCFTDKDKAQAELERREKQYPSQKYKLFTYTVNPERQKILLGKSDESL